MRRWDTRRTRPVNIEQKRAGIWSWFLPRRLVCFIWGTRVVLPSQYVLALVLALSVHVKTNSGGGTSFFSILSFAEANFVRSLFLSSNSLGTQKSSDYIEFKVNSYAEPVCLSDPLTVEISISAPYFAVCLDSIRTRCNAPTRRETEKKKKL